MKETDKTKIRRRKEARPAEIIAAGITEFSKYGYARARLDRIARNAGISKATIYLYYESKEALFLAAVETYMTATMAENEDFLDTFDGTTKQMLTRLLRSVYDRFAEGHAQSVMRIMITEGDRIPDAVSTYHAMTIQRGTSLLRRILKRGVDRGEVSPNAIIDNPQVIIAPAMFFALHNMMFSKAGDLEFDGYFDAHLALVLNGVMSDV
ncbi:TetR/AcrR family transcriptional regulator [Roseobacter sp. CCS2]|uniref:TetR/AcrR family transcriptional regulator n=1 Tax=Roseobacter sp. CCS2 TaxID=391593 RepID=UPI0002D8D7C6|nr:TetR/AcrR family transcriptional regulator [Roseobacter sp. CCS2]